MGMMYNTLSKTGFGALAIGVALALSPMKVDAATIKGQIDISGSVNLLSSDFSATGNADLNDPGTVILAFGDFDTYVNQNDPVTMTDIDFTSPGQIWSVGGFTFKADSFSNFVNSSIKGFDAAGFISGNGFSPTAGLMSFSTQERSQSVIVSFSSTTVPVPLPAGGLMLLTALGGLAVARRKRKAA